MVSLLKLAEITEQGVKFESPHDGSEMMLTPEKSIEIQNSIGKDGWMTCNFTSFLAVFQSYQDNRQ